MIALDTNVLVHAHREDAAFHGPALECVSTLAEGRAPWAIPWPCLHEFIAIATHARIFDPPSTLAQAMGQVQAWLDSPSLVLLHESERHWDELQRLLRAGRVAGPMVHDARIAALCLQHGVRVLWTADRDFGRFPALKTENPLIARA